MLDYVYLTLLLFFCLPLPKHSILFYYEWMMLSMKNFVMFKLLISLNLFNTLFFQGNPFSFC